MFNLNWESASQSVYYIPISPGIPLKPGDPRVLSPTKAGGYYVRILGYRCQPGSFMCRLGSLDTHRSFYITYIHVWACPQLFPGGEYFLIKKIIPGDPRVELPDIAELA